MHAAHMQLHVPLLRAPLPLQVAASLACPIWGPGQCIQLDEALIDFQAFCIFCIREALHTVTTQVNHDVRVRPLPLEN